MAAKNNDADESGRGFLMKVEHPETGLSDEEWHSFRLAMGLPDEEQPGPGSSGEDRLQDSEQGDGGGVSHA